MQDYNELYIRGIYVQILRISDDIINYSQGKDWSCTDLTCHYDPMVPPFFMYAHPKFKGAPQTTI